MPERHSIIWRGNDFTHCDACRVSDAALRAAARTIVVDLTHARDATTSAFAQLVVLRRRLLKTGKDLRIKGLGERAARIYEVSRLGRVLPADSATTHA